MLKFNWSSIKKYTNNDINKITQYLNTMLIDDKVHLYSFLLENKWATQIYNSGESKSSYILNLEGFLRNRLRGSKEELFVYLELLSQRNSFDYYNTKGRVSYLPIWKVSELYDINKLKANRLLEIDEHNIHFIYEIEEKE
jgi:hypothetical protein